MKKAILIGILTLSLCTGCVQSTAESSMVTDESSDDVICELIDSTEVFKTVEEYLASKTCQKLKNDGGKIYLLEYDTERYKLTGILGGDSFYEYQFHDNEKDTSIHVELAYDPGLTDIEQYRSFASEGNNFITTASRNNKEYGVCLSEDTNADGEDYTLLYVPFEKCRVGIYSTNHATAEEILEYFDDFELVPAK